MKRYFIRHNPTCNYLPQPTGRSGRGGSHTEPTADDNNARIFLTKLGAQRALTAWLMGKFISSGWDEDCGTYCDHVEWQPHRIKEDMEIIEVEIKLP